MSRQFNAVIKALSQLNEQSEDNAITHQHNICTITNAICQPAGGQAGGTKILLNIGDDDVIAIYSNSNGTLVYVVCCVINQRSSWQKTDHKGRDRRRDIVKALSADSSVSSSESVEASRLLPMTSISSVCTHYNTQVKHTQVKTNVVLLYQNVSQGQKCWADCSPNSVRYIKFYSVAVSSWPTIPVFLGQYRFGTLCPGIPNVVFGTPKCPGLAPDVPGGTELNPHNQLHCFVWPFLITIYCL